MKKVLSMALVLTLLITCLSCGSVFAATSSETVLVDEDFSTAEESTSTPKISGFTSNVSSNSGLSIVTDSTEGYGEVLQKTSGSTSTNTYSYVLSESISTGTVVVSFDTRADYDEIKSNSGTGATENFGFYFQVNKAGCSVFRTRTSFSEDVYAMDYGTGYESYNANQAGKFQNSKWVHVDLVYDCSTCKMKYYINGESYGSEYALMKSDKTTQASGPLTAIQFRAVSSAPNTTYLDNLKIVHNPGAGAMSASVKAPAGKNYIDVRFNKTLAKTADFSGAALVNAGAYEEVAVSAAKLTSDTVRLSFTGNLDAADTYVLTFPNEVTSAFGDSFKGEIPFVTETTDKKTYINEDFENIPAMGDTDNAPTISGWNVNGTLTAKSTVDVAESNGSNALRVSPKTTEKTKNVDYRLLFGEEATGTLTTSFDTWVDSSADSTGISIQFGYVNKAGATKQIADLAYFNADKYYFRYNTFNNDTFEKLIGVTENTKMHIDLVCDVATKTVKIYIDDVLKKTVAVDISDISGFQFNFTTQSKVNAYIDNVVIKQESVKTAVESVGYVTADGTVYGNVIGKAVSALKVKFNKAFDEADISKVTLTAGGEDVSYTASYSEDKTELTLTAAIDAGKNCVLTLPVGSETRSYAFTTAVSGKATLDKVTCEASGSDLKVKVYVTDTEGAKGDALMLVKVTGADGKVTTVRAYSVNLAKGSNVFDKTLSGVSGTKAEAFFVDSAANFIPVL